jgi:hypothetical protein
MGVSKAVGLPVAVDEAKMRVLECLGLEPVGEKELGHMCALVRGWFEGLWGMSRLALLLMMIQVEEGSGGESPSDLRL